MNELHAMRTFAQIVDTGSFVNAARAMDVAPAVVTRLVSDLERHLGARLLTRTTRRLALTDVGGRYLEKVRGILVAVDEAAALARHSQLEPMGALRVRVPHAFAASQLTPRLPRFHALHPQVVVELDAGPVESISAEHDVTLVVQQPQLDGRFIARLLARSTLVACATPAYLDRHGRPTHPGQLGEHALLMPTMQRSFTLRRGAEVASVAPPRSPLNLTNPDLHAAAALSGLGIAGLASYAAGQALRDGLLERVLPDWTLGELSVWACVPTRQHMPAAARAFLDFLLAEFGGREHDPWLPPPSVADEAFSRRAA